MLCRIQTPQSSPRADGAATSFAHRCSTLLVPIQSRLRTNNCHHRHKQITTMSQICRIRIDMVLFTLPDLLVHRPHLVSLYRRRLLYRLSRPLQKLTMLITATPMHIISVVYLKSQKMSSQIMNLRPLTDQPLNPLDLPKTYQPRPLPLHHTPV